MKNTANSPTDSSQPNGTKHNAQSDEQKEVIADCFGCDTETVFIIGHQSHPENHIPEWVLSETSATVRQKPGTPENEPKPEHYADHLTGWCPSCQKHFSDLSRNDTAVECGYNNAHPDLSIDHADSHQIASEPYHDCKWLGYIPYRNEKLSPLEDQNLSQEDFLEKLWSIGFDVNAHPFMREGTAILMDFEFIDSNQGKKESTNAESEIIKEIIDEATKFGIEKMVVKINFLPENEPVDATHTQSLTDFFEQHDFEVEKNNTDTFVCQKQLQ